MDATIIVFDVGANSNCDYNKTQSFFEAAKQCIESIITRKIFTKPKEELSLILLGTKSTDNELNKAQGGYDHITHALEMRPMSWDILEYVQKNIEPPSDVTGDWLDGVIVACDHFNRLELNKCTKKIILITTFTTDVNDDSIDSVITGLQKLEIELIVITKNVIYESDQDSEDQYACFSQAAVKDKIQEKSEKLIKRIVLQTDGVLCSLDEAVAKMIYVDKKQKKRMPWNADLSFGTLFSIKISAFIYVRDDKELGLWKTKYVSKTVTDTISPTGSSVEFGDAKTRVEHIYNDTPMDADAAVENLINGYMYSGVAVPFDDEKFDNGGKGLKCIGFTPSRRIKYEYMVGDSIWAVVPQKNMTSSAIRLAAMIEAMYQKDYAIIARYTYRDGTAPKLMALYPHDDCLLMHELMFKDNHVSLNKPRFVSKTNAPIDEQLVCMDEFIDSMDLTEDGGSFKNLLDPGLQFAYRAIAQRAINPKEPMPEIDGEIAALIEPPKQPDVAEIKTLFPLVAKLSSKEKFQQQMQTTGNEKSKQVDEDDIVKPKHDIHEIGTIKPDDDFVKLLEQGESFVTLSAQMQTVIFNLAVKSIVAMDEKILRAMLVYRETAKNKAPFKYNEWITKFKDILKEREKIQLWQSLSEEKLGLITGQESEISTISEDEAEIFYKMKIENIETQVGSKHNEFNDPDDDIFDDV